MLSFVSRSILLLFTLMAVHQIPARAQHKVWRQYTIADGLPGNAVYDMLQDSKGYMWFVTDQGICRFNGYEFVQPVDSTSLSGSEAFIPVEDNQGRIWFNRINQSLWFIENDTVKEWHFNRIIDAYRDKFSVIDQMAIDEDGSVWLGLSTTGFLIIESSGRATFNKQSSPNLIFTKIKNRLIHAANGIPIDKFISKATITAEIVNLSEGKEVVIEKFNIVNKNFIHWGAWLLKNDTVLSLFNSTYCIIFKEKVHSRFQSHILAEKVVHTKSGAILLASHIGQEPGLFLYSSLEELTKGNGKNILPHYLVTDVYADHEGGWWASTKNGGVLYCKNPGISFFDNSSGLPSSNILRLASDGEKMIFAGLDSKDIIAIDHKNYSIAIFPKPEVEDNVLALVHQKTNNRLWCGSNLKYWDGAKWVGVSFTNSFNIPTPINAKHVSFNPSGNKLWMSSSHGLISVESQSLTAKHYSDLSQNATSNRTYAVLEDATGTVWVATMQGLKVLNDENFLEPPFTHSALQAGIRYMVLLKDNVIAFGSPGRGIAFRYPDGQVIEFTENDGLSSNDINMLKAGPGGELYVCTSSGINRLIPLDDRSWNIQNIGVKQGLPSNMVNDVVTLGEEMWIGTDKGLVRIKEIPEAYPVSIPIIDQVDVDNQKIPDIEHIRLHYDKNNITINFYSLHFRSDGDILYRYRLSEADTTYNFTTQREVNYAKLAPGKYTFEVQAQQEDRSWSNPALVFFEIAHPWWVRWWFIALLLIMVSGIAALIVRTRLKGFRRSAAIELKIKDLEMAALRAQINPHFIFNCLGSIQQFIAENDSAAATRYLARFAKLVRLALHSSIDGKHSLADEISMLDNYLALEQMRFKGRFHYQIDSAGIDDIDDVHIPPMLLQPFVENAVKHGIGNTESEGEIQITFSKKDNMLLAVITDNGPGFTTMSSESNNPHKSVGLSLTRNRLDLLSGSPEGNSYAQKNITSLDGEIQGARVEIRIPLA